MIFIMVSHFNYKHRCLIEKNVPIALIIPSRWQCGAESPGIERTSCLWPTPLTLPCLPPPPVVVQMSLLVPLLVAVEAERRLVDRVAFLVPGIEDVSAVLKIKIII